MKKCHKRKTWMERWFILRSNALSYYLSEDLVDKRGEVLLDQSSIVQVRKSTALSYRASYELLS